MDESRKGLFKLCMQYDEQRNRRRYNKGVILHLTDMTNNFNLLTEEVLFCNQFREERDSRLIACLPGRLS
jgi:hypothetical protein